MTIDITEIVSLLKKERMAYEYHGNRKLSISGFSPLSDPKPNTITWIKKIDNYSLDQIDSNLGLLIVVDSLPVDTSVQDYNLIVTKDPKATYFEILNTFFVVSERYPSVSPSAIVETSLVGDNVIIGHNCYICSEAKIGSNVTIMNNVVIECPTVIGNDCIIESGTIIGTRGYGYYTTHEKEIRKVPDFGGVVIGNRVEIGANVCIARGALADTIIEDDVKIDNLCHIAHNVHIGARCYVVALSMLAGSSSVEEDAYIAPGSMIMNQKTVGRNSFVGLGAVVLDDVEPNKVVVGVPARAIRENS